MHIKCQAGCHFQQIYKNKDGKDMSLFYSMHGKMMGTIIPNAELNLIFHKNNCSKHDYNKHPDLDPKNHVDEDKFPSVISD